MLIETLKLSEKRGEADTLVFCYTQRNKKPIATSSLKDYAELREIPLANGDFSAKEGEISLLYTSDKMRCVLLGFGDEKMITLDKIRRGFAQLTRFCHLKKIDHCQIAFSKFRPFSIKESFRAAIEGMYFANYHFDRKLRREEKPHLIKKATFLGVDNEEKLRDELSHIFSGVNLARDLINESADIVTSELLAEVAKKLGNSSKNLKVKVLGKNELEKEKMGLLLAVNRGSFRDPALIVLDYEGNKRSKEKTVVIGKGITFDTGGLNLKPTGGMEEMKADMSGAATVLGIIRAAIGLKLKTNIVGVIPATENAIGSKSYKPGDVYMGKGGLSVEIINTDAEGRLVLADAIAYATEHLNPKRIIDFATLTGAVEIALGNLRSGLFTNDETLGDAIKKAGETTGEKVWPFPIDPEYRLDIKSEVADLRNRGKSRRAGAIIAAVFLQQFVKGISWAHLDIAGVAYLDEKHFFASHATGYGVRLFIEMLKEINEI